jgi:hypothetical protein
MPGYFTPVTSTPLKRGIVRRSLLLVLIAAAVGCSSDATGVRTPGGEVLTTVASATSAPLEDSIELALRISNPTSNSLTLYIGEGANVYAVFSENGAVRGDTGAAANPVVVDTITIAAGASTTLSPDRVHFATPGVAEGFAVGETFSLDPGTWSLEACVFTPGQGSQSQLWVSTCGNTISFTVQQ